MRGIFGDASIGGPRGRPPARSIPLRRLLSIAARNLGRHGRRSALTGACVAASAAALVAFMGYYRGTYDEMFYSAIIDYQTAHAQIQAVAFDPEDPSGWAKPEASIRGWERAAGAAREVPAARGVAPRLELACFAGDGIEKLPALFAGVDFAAERGVSPFADRISRGSLPSGRGQVLVGDELASLFSLDIGSPLLVQTSTSSGAPNIARFAVAGIFDTGFSGLDAAFVAAPLEDAQELADAPGVVNRIYVRLSGMDAVAGAMEGIEAAAGLSGARALPWTHYARGAIEHARTETVFYYVFLAILVLVSSSAISGTMRVAVYERVREIGTLRATGWTRNDVFSLFVLESAAVGLCGTAVGAALGGLVSAYLRAHPIDVTAMASAIDYPFFAMTSSSRPSDFLLAAVVGVGSALAAGVSPAVRAARTNIAKALSTH
jgi:putative ABC transport system permease protein